jgi:hypothetical protein
LGRKLDWYDLRVEPPPPSRGGKPLLLLPRLLPIYQYHKVTGDIRNGNSQTLLTDLPERGGVLVRVGLEDGRRTKAQKKILVAISAHGWPPNYTCPRCGERIPYAAAQLNGQLLDTSPANLKWVPNAEDELRHRTLDCLDDLIREHPYKLPRRRHPGLVQEYEMDW